MAINIQANPHSEAARLALKIYADALEAVRADTLVKRQVRLDGDILWIVADQFDLKKYDRILVVGAGKASAAMAAALEDVLGDRITKGVVVTKHGHALPTRRIEILEAAHPIPDESSVAAGKRIHELATEAGERDLVICLLSGGASALMELPVEGLSLKDLQEATSLLMKAGAPIEELNVVRPCLSQLKAGGLARAAAPARVLCLVLSDVLGNSLSIIGSGPCVDLPIEPGHADSILFRLGLANQIPLSVKMRLQYGVTPRPATLNAYHYILGDIWTAIRAARESAVRSGLKPMVLSGFLEGEAREAGKILGGIARDLPQTATREGHDCLILGGETTVTVRGEGKGGRSQEIACAAIPPLAGIEGVALLAGGTDGTDGPTDAAGGLAESDTMERADDLLLNLQDSLNNNDSYPFLESAGGLIKTGPTHSNVGDLIIMVYKQQA